MAELVRPLVPVHHGSVGQTEFHKSVITDHVATNNHLIDWEQPQILDRESDQYTRQIREAVQIRLHRDVMNQDQGTYRLSHVYDPLFAVVSDGNERK